jgi:hypothetical protein
LQIWKWPDVVPPDEACVMSEQMETPNVSPARKINLELRFTQYHLPPLDNALIIGKRAAVGANSISRAFEELSPGAFRLIRVEHDVAEAVLVRTSDLRKFPEAELIRRMLLQADQIMDDTDTLHVRLHFEIIVGEEDIRI